jgi:hypothetical protein
LRVEEQAKGVTSLFLLFTFAFNLYSSTFAKKASLSHTGRLHQRAGLKPGATTYVVLSG